MIAARLHKPDGGVCVMLVLEPGNLEKLKKGQPIHKFLNEFMPELRQNVELLFAYSPDIEWVAQQAKGAHDAATLAEIVEESLTRKPVIRDSKSAEDLKREF